MTITSALRHLIPQEELTEPLSPVELQRLHTWKLRYVAEVWGLEPDHACFYRWLREQGRVTR